MRPADQLEADVRHAERFECRDVVRHEAQRARERPTLEEQVGTDAGRLSEREGEVEFTPGQQLLPSGPGEGLSERARLVGGQWVVGQANECPVHPCGRRRAWGEEQVRAVAVRDVLQERLDAFIHDGRQCTVARMASGQILIVSADERWRRLLEVTIQLAGAGTTTGASLAEAVSGPIADATAPTAARRRPRRPGHHRRARRVDGPASDGPLARRRHPSRSGSSGRATGSSRRPRGCSYARIGRPNSSRRSGPTSLRSSLRPRPKSRSPSMGRGPRTPRRPRRPRTRRPVGARVFAWRAERRSPGPSPAGSSWPGPGTSGTATARSVQGWPRRPRCSQPPR